MVDDLVHALEAMGIRRGERIFVHSSFKSLGLSCDDGSEVVVEALKQCVGNDGTIGMPTFTYSFTPQELYNPGTSPSKTGAISEAFRKSPGVVRSFSPSHSVAFWGRDADYCARSTCGLPPYSARGPFGKLYELDFKIVMLGCGLAPNSTLHAVEHWAELPYCRNGVHACFSLHDGHEAGRQYSHMPIGHRDFYRGKESFNAKYAKLLKRHGALNEGKAGASTTYWMGARPLVDLCMKELDRHPDLFLCDNPECSSCRGNRYDFDLWKRRGGSGWYGVWLGAAKACVNPGVGAYANQGWGVGVPCEGIQDDIHARALVFRRKERRLALVSLDVCVIDLDVSALIKEAVRGKTGILPEDIVISATHTHFSPALGARRIWKTGNIRDDAYIGHLAAVVAGVVYEAANKVEPVSFSFSRRKVGIGNINRRVEMPDGSFKYYDYSKPESRPEPNGPVADGFSMFFFKNRAGEVKAGIGCYACHPIFGPVWARKISGDYPGEFSRVAERELGEGSVVCFLQGACGDQMPRQYGLAFEGAAKAGRTLAHAFLDRVENAVFKPLRRMSLRTKPYRIINADDEVDTLLQALALDNVRIGFGPGEMFYRLEGQFRENVGFPSTVLVGYTDALGYLPTAEAFAHPTYEVNGCKQWIKGKPGVGEEVVDALAELVKEL